MVIFFKFWTWEARELNNKIENLDDDLDISELAPNDQKLIQTFRVDPVTFRSIPDIECYTQKFSIGYSKEMVAQACDEFFEDLNTIKTIGEYAATKVSKNIHHVI